jgi:hypothetical protein
MFSLSEAKSDYSSSKEHFGNQPATVQGFLGLSVHSYMNLALVGFGPIGSN